ncbi:MAG: hypothetical protein R3C68_17465 [Myxococcota bacterium]
MPAKKTKSSATSRKTTGGSKKQPKGTDTKVKRPAKKKKSAKKADANKSRQSQDAPQRQTSFTSLADALRTLPQGHPEKRRHIRFPAAPDSVARIDAKAETPRFIPQIAALVVEEAHRGCRLVFLPHENLVVGALCRLEVGKLGVFVGKLVWCQRVTPHICQGGFEYIREFQSEPA